MNFEVAQSGHHLHHFTARQSEDPFVNVVHTYLPNGVVALYQIPHETEKHLFHAGE